MIAALAEPIPQYHEWLLVMAINAVFISTGLAVLVFLLIAYIAKLLKG